ncbi:MAG TPA: dTDP-4-dehydrorhamnose reductase [Planctomicrobium sp.]|nr:dTDP-4-dehydrorhamnose reductase [Planctomicrobium sp.]
MLVIFGKNGQVALELQRAATILQIPYVVYSSSEADFRSPERVVKVLSEITSPAVVINAAAYTQVDLAESNAEEALLINAKTPEAIASVCRSAGHQLIHISTDYVFSGDHPAPYVETDETNPQGVYGRTKFEGEQRIQEQFPDAVILRTSWVFSSHGKNFVKTMLRLSDTRKAVSVVSDQQGGPTSAESIADCCLTIAAILKETPRHHRGGIYHFSGTPSTTWHGFANEIFRLAQRTVTVHPITTADYPTPAKRPANSRLDCSKIAQTFSIELPDWRNDLKRVLEEIETPE